MILVTDWNIKVTPSNFFDSVPFLSLDDSKFHHDESALARIQSLPTVHCRANLQELRKTLKSFRCLKRQHIDWTSTEQLSVSEHQLHMETTPPPLLLQLQDLKLWRSFHGRGYTAHVQKRSEHRKPDLAGGAAGPTQHASCWPKHKLILLTKLLNPTGECCTNQKRFLGYFEEDTNSYGKSRDPCVGALSHFLSLFPLCCAVSIWI